MHVSQQTCVYIVFRILSIAAGQIYVFRSRYLAASKNTSMTSVVIGSITSPFDFGLFRSSDAFPYSSCSLTSGCRPCSETFKFVFTAHQTRNREPCFACVNFLLGFLQRD